MRTFVVVALAACSHPAAPRPASSSAIDGVIAAFDRAPVVAIDEHHRSATCHAFLDDLIRDPRFAAAANDIVIEFANPLHQDVLDRFVAGDAVDDRELRHVWQDTTQLLAWDAPVYRQMLETVRDVNRTLPADRKLRVVAGDPPIDWSTVHTGADYEPFAARDPDTARIIDREVLGRHRKALLVIGGLHLPRRNPLARARGHEGSPSVTQLLEQQHPHSVAVIWTVIGRSAVVAGWTPREMHPATGALGARSFGELMPDKVTMLVEVDGKRVPREVPQTEFPPIADVVDAIAYLGPETGEVEAPAELYRDAAYVQALRERAVVLKEAFGIDFTGDIDAEVKRAGP